MIIKGRCHECTGRRLRRGQFIALHLEEENDGLAHFHPSCLVRWLSFLPNDARGVALKAKVRALLDERRVVKPADDSSMRESLRARVDAMPDAVVPQHPLGWTPDDETPNAGAQR